MRLVVSEVRPHREKKIPPSNTFGLDFQQMRTMANLDLARWKSEAYTRMYSLTDPGDEVVRVDEADIGLVGEQRQGGADDHPFPLAVSHQPIWADYFGKPGLDEGLGESWIALVDHHRRAAGESAEAFDGVALHHETVDRLAIAVGYEDQEGGVRDPGEDAFEDSEPFVAARDHDGHAPLHLEHRSGGDMADRGAEVSLGLREVGVQLEDVLHSVDTNTAEAVGLIWEGEPHRRSLLCCER
jgi:hypothetical protein